MWISRDVCRGVVAFAIDISGLTKRWRIWSLDFKNALLQTDGSGREAYVRDPYEWKSLGAFRVWKSGAAALGLSGAQAASRRPLRRYLASSAEPRPKVGLRFEAPSRGPRPASYFASREGLSAPWPHVLMIFRAAARPRFS